MSTKTRYILQGLFFIILGLFCLYSYFTGKGLPDKRFSMAGTIFGLFIGIIFLKNAFK